MNEIITGLYEAVQAGHWFAVVGLAATLLTTLIKRFTPTIAAKLPGSNRWIPIALSFIMTIGVAASEAAGDWGRFAAIVAVGGLEAAITAIGLYHAVQPRKPKDEAPATPRNTGTPPGPLVAGLVLCLTLSGCSALGFSTPALSADEARAARVAYVGLSAAADELERDADGKAAEHLADAQAALDLVFRALTEKRDPTDDLLDAVEAIELAAGVLQREGVELPDEIAQALLLARFAVAARGG